MAEDQTQQLANLIASALYIDVLRSHVARGLKLVAMDQEIALSLVTEALQASGKQVSELRRVLDSDRVAFNHFVEAKLALFSNDNKEDYAPGEIPPKEERAKTLVVHGYPETFLIPHLCEYCIASSDPSDLEAYAKRYRLPKAKHYAKSVIRLFKEARSKTT
jgi:hypothetical protein